MTDPLTSRDRVVLMALMALNEEVSNAVLKERVGFTLEGAARRRLNDLGLVTSTKRGHPLWHELTDKGWAWCWDEMAQQAPARSDSGTRGLYAVLAGLRRYLERADLRLSDVFGLPARGEDQPLADRIRSAYRRLAVEPGDWVSLTDVRRLLDGADRTEVDESLRRLEREPDVHLVPETDQRRLTPADRESAIRIGGKDKHLLKVDRP
jgi:hypothetical protein